MYGMVNEGIRSLIEGSHGPDAWETVCTGAGIADRSFDRMHAYDDKLTYELVGSICRFTGKTSDEVLRAFGRYWVDYMGSSNFGNLMRLAGPTFMDRVRGLDDMHERILLSMPHLKPPSFDVEEVATDRFFLHYHSDREGLAPMVIGLLYGMAEVTGETIDVEHVTKRDAEGAHDVFEIRLMPDAG